MQRVSPDPIVYDPFHDVFCSICHQDNPQEDATALICIGCYGVFHCRCLKLSSVPPQNPWYCPGCTDRESNDNDQHLTELESGVDAMEIDEGIVGDKVTDVDAMDIECKEGSLVFLSVEFCMVLLPCPVLIDLDDGLDAGGVIWSAVSSR